MTLLKELDKWPVAWQFLTWLMIGIGGILMLVLIIDAGYRFSIWLPKAWARYATVDYLPDLQFQAIRR